MLAPDFNTFYRNIKNNICPLCHNKELTILHLYNPNDYHICYNCIGNNIIHYYNYYQTHNEQYIDIENKIINYDIHYNLTKQSICEMRFKNKMIVRDMSLKFSCFINLIYWKKILQYVNNKQLKE